MLFATPTRPAQAVRTPPTTAAATESGSLRDDLGLQYVYAVVTPRARGLSIGVNMNPDKQCNYDCAYCEVDRSVSGKEGNMDLDLLALELRETLGMARSGLLRARPAFANVPKELMRLAHVTLSGDGEPTLAPQFDEILETAVHVRALAKSRFVKLVLITNGTGLDRPEVARGLECLNGQDEIWAKLDAGAEEHYRRVCRTSFPLEQVVQNITTLARTRPVVIQSLFCGVEGIEPTDSEITAYIEKLSRLTSSGGKIAQVQIYSANRPSPQGKCSHLSLRRLAEIAGRVREETGLKVEMY